MKIVTVVLASMGVMAALALVTAIPGGWALMLLMGVLHLDVYRGIPAVGFGTAYALALFLSWLLAWVHPRTGSSD
jgi:hypothetical protein